MPKSPQASYGIATGWNTSVEPIVQSRDPTTLDVGYDVFQPWFNSDSYIFWVLVSYDSSSGTVLANWQQQSGNLNELAVDTSSAPGTNPVVPDTDGDITITGAQVASSTIGANVIRTNSLAASEFTIQIQQAGEAAAEDTTLNGVCHFDSTHFSISNGFVTLSGAGMAVDSFIPDTGTNPVVPDASGRVSLIAQTPANVSGIRTTGGTNSLSFSLFSPYEGDFAFTQSTDPSAEPREVLVSNADTANATSDACFIAQVGGTSSGDAYLLTAVGNSRSYAFGPDTSDSSILKIATSNSASTTPSSGTTLLQSTSAGVITIPNFLYVGTSSPTSVGLDLIVEKEKSGSNVAIEIRNDSGDANSEATLALVTGTGGGTRSDAWMIFQLNGAAGQADWSVGGYNVDGSYRISENNGLGTNDTLIITSAGEVTKPLQPAFLATHTVAQNDVTGNGANVTINFTNEVFDLNSDYDGTNTFTAPVTGRYFFNCSVAFAQLDANAVEGVIRFVTTAGNFQSQAMNYGAIRQGGASANIAVLSHCCFVQLSATNTVTVQVQISGMGGDTVDIPAEGSLTYFSGYLVC